MLKPMVPAQRGFGAGLAAPRRLSWLGGTAALIAAIGLVMLAARESGVPELRRPEVLNRTGQVAKEAPAEPSAGQKERPDQAPAPADDRAASRAYGEHGAYRANANEEAKDKRGTPAAGQRTENLKQAQRGIAQPSRVVRLQRDEKTGEMLPVPEQSRLGFAKPPAPETPAAGSATRIPKPGAAPLSESRTGGRQAELFGSEGEKGAAAPSLEAQEKTLADRAAPSRGTLSTEGGQLCGTVRDPSGRAIAGANVAIADLGLIATTNAQGRYCIAAPPGDHTLSVMAVGFESARRSLRVPASAEAADVTLAAVAVLGKRGVLDRSERAKSSVTMNEVAKRFAWPTVVAEQAGKAQSTTERAATMRSAWLYDRAATEWALALEGATGATEVEIRARLADARYRAWEIAPDATRKAAAEQALVGYLAKAPAGAARTVAQKRLELLRR